MSKREGNTMSKQEELSIDEIFYSMPKLRAYFKDREWKIRKYEKLERIESAVEEWRKEREVLLQVAQKMDIEDLRFVYYLQIIKGAGEGQILRKLKKITKEIEEFFEL
jgi:hypothetical protein